MTRNPSVRRRMQPTKTASLRVGTGALAAAALVLAALAPSALAADKPLVAPSQPAAPAISVPAGLPAPPAVPPDHSQASQTVPPPSNDDFSSAQVIEGYSGAASGSNVGATSEEGEPSLPFIDDSGPYHSVWYSWIAPGSGTVTFDLCTDTGPDSPGGVAATFDSKMGAYTGSRVFSLTNVAANDDFCGGSSQISFTAVAGTTYSITIDGYSGDSGYFLLQWNMAAPARTISIDDATAAEGDSGDPVQLSFKISLSSAADDNVFVNWETIDGTATAPDDYVAADGEVEIYAGSVSTTVTVDIVGDLVHEADETFSVVLSQPDGAIIGDGTAVATIENDDMAADLVVYVNKFGGKVRAGGYLAYYVQVFNPYGSDTSAATVTDVLPANTTFNYVDSTQGSCTGGSTIVCAFGDVAGGSYAAAVIYAIPNRTGVYTNTVTLEGSLPDPNPEDNIATVQTTVFADKAGCTMVGTYENDTITGTPGDDVICTYGGDDVIDAGDGNDTVRAGSGNDIVYGGRGFDQLDAAAGQDTLFGGADPDVIDGGSGRDTVSYGDDPGPVDVNLLTGIGYDGYASSPLQGANYDTLISVGDAVGSAYADTLVGGDDLSNLFGGLGDDTIKGLGSRDYLDGGPGTDSLDGGAKRDTCVNGEVLKRCEL